MGRKKLEELEIIEEISEELEIQEGLEQVEELKKDYSEFYDQKIYTKCGSFLIDGEKFDPKFCPHKKKDYFVIDKETPEKAVEFILKKRA